MTKTRTTIILPETLLKAAKYKAIENNLNLSQLMEKALNLILADAQAKYMADQEKEEKKALIRRLSGQFNLGDMSPQKIKKIIMDRYDEESLS